MNVCPSHKYIYILQWHFVQQEHVICALGTGAPAGGGPEQSASSFSRCDGFGQMMGSMLPVRRLCCENICLNRLGDFSNDEGTVPVNWLSFKNTSLRFVRDPNSEGMLPVNLLLLRSIVQRFAKEPNDGGMVPVNWLFLRDRS